MLKDTTVNLVGMSYVVGISYIVGISCKSKDELQE